MRIGILGAGMIGSTLAKAAIDAAHAEGFLMRVELS